MRERDYRRSDYAENYEIAERKSGLLEEIERDHSLGINVYSLICREVSYKKKLAYVYGRRCAYCGAILGPLPLGSFQVDHIACRKDIDNGVALLECGGNGLDNLAYSCGYCNGKKRDFSIYGDHFELLSPDGQLGYVYSRDEHYRIVIDDQYNGIEKVVLFHEKMRFGDDLRRVDYLLSSMCDLVACIEREKLFGGFMDGICDHSKVIIYDLAMARNSKW